MPDQLQQIADLLQRINRKIEDLPANLKLSARQVFATELSQISNNAGLLTSGEFRVGNGKDPGEGFTGVRMAYPPMLYSGGLYPFVSVNTDVLQVGISLTDGKLYAGQGAVIIDSDGLTINQGTDESNKIKFGTGASKIGDIYGWINGVDGSKYLSITAEPEAEDEDEVEEIGRAHV